MLQRLTINAQKILDRAKKIAQEFNSPRIEPEHLLLATANQSGSLAFTLLQKYNLKFTNLKAEVKKFQSLKIRSDKNLTTQSLNKELPNFSQLSLKILASAAAKAVEAKHLYIGSEHLLFALTEKASPAIIKILQENKIDRQQLLKHCLVALKNSSRFSDLSALFSLAGPEKFTQEKDISRTPALDYFSTNLSDPKIQENIDPVIGRVQEIERVIQILCRRIKNNPVLLGDPGVGKTAIVEGLAKKIMEGKIPTLLKSKRILKLDLTSLVAGTMFRGEFESRIKKIIEEVKSDPNIILFIDEIHTIIGAGSANGSLDAANILKPALSKGEIRCIGATTQDEYRKHIENDPALERRFQTINIAEPNSEETLEILRGLKPFYQDYHQVKITDEALATAIRLSLRYLPEKFLPDKAIDLIDEAASKLKVQTSTHPLKDQLQTLEFKIRKLAEEKQQAVSGEDFDTAIRYKEEEKRLKKKLLELEQKTAKQVPTPEVTAEEIAKVIARMTKIPISELITSERDKILNLEKLLKQHIVGQDEAIKLLASTIRRSRAGISNPNRPLGSLLFLGPSGVGKTETAKSLARILFDDPRALIQIDMSEFKESFNISKLIGAPAGYIGYQEGGKLTEAVRRRPYAVILFDEIEKANPEVVNLLLQILEEGHLTDARGKKINFKNTIIILTSNIGVKEFNRQATLGFESTKTIKSQEKFKAVADRVLSEMKKILAPELLNRLDKIVVFNSLNRQDLEKIIEFQVAELNQRLTEQKITLILTRQAEKLLAKLSEESEAGARLVRQKIQDLIEGPLAEKIIAREIKPNSTIKVKTKGQKLDFSIQKS